MNLSLILNPAAASAAPGAPAAAPASPEMASFQDFLALVGLPPMQAESGEDDQPEVAPDGLDPDLAALTGNILPPVLPPALPVLPPVETEALATDTRPAATMAANAIVQAQMAGLPMPPVTAQQLMADATNSAVTADKTVAAANPAGPVFAPLAVTIEAVPATQAEPQRVASQPVLARLMQAQQTQVGNKPPTRRDEAVALAAIPATPLAAAVPAAETARPVTQASAADTPPQVDLPMVLVATSTQAPSAPATVASASEAAPAAHDFAAVVDRLTEARELARPGRADLHLTHREFGAVSVQFELAGQSLKVAMSSPDQAFAPAVQAALAERPLTVADVSRADSTQPRTDVINASTAAFHAGTQADSQRGQGQQAPASQRGVADQPSTGRSTDADSGEASTDQSGRFA